MILRLFLLTLVLAIFCEIPTAEASSSCGRWLKRVSLLLAKPLHPLLFSHRPLRELGDEPFFKKRRGKMKPQFQKLERFILDHPNSVLEDHTKEWMLNVIMDYRSSTTLKLDIFHPVAEPRLIDIVDYLRTHIAEIKADISQSEVRHPRGYIRATIKYRWIILGMTVFVLFEPIQAEVRSLVYAAFNSGRSIVDSSGAPEVLVDERLSKEMMVAIKSELRNIFFATNDQYPTTMQMSRNSINYIYDLVLKRRSDLAIAKMVNDEKAIQWNLMYLYLLPYIYHDLLGSPLTGFVREILDDTLQKYDPNGLLREEFNRRVGASLDAR